MQDSETIHLDRASARARIMLEERHGSTMYPWIVSVRTNSDRWSCEVFSTESQARGALRLIALAADIEL